MARLFTNRELLDLFQGPCRQRTDNGRELIEACECCFTPTTAERICRTCAETASLSLGTRVFPSRSSTGGRSL